MSLPMPMKESNSSSSKTMREDGFTLVVNKKRRNFFFEKYVTSLETNDSEVDKTDTNNTKILIQDRTDRLTPENYTLAVLAWADRVKCSLKEINSTSYMTNVFAKLHLALKDLSKEKHDISHIICYGLGSLVKHWESRIQLAFLISLKKEFGNHICVQLYDPDFTNVDKSVIQNEFGFDVIPINEEGNRKVDSLTILYLPHCPHGLCNNILRTNWTAELLSKCIVIGNSFNNVRVSAAPKVMEKNVPYIMYSSPVCVEYELNDEYRFFEAIHQLSIHIFPQHLCNLQTLEFWLRDDSLENKVVTKKSIDHEHKTHQK